MAGPSKEQTLSLLAAANSHGDLAVKLSSLRQVKDILSSVDPSSAAEVFPYLVKLQSSPESLVRRLLIEVLEEIGLKALNHSAVLMPVLVSLSKDSDHSVAHQSITSGMKLFCAVLEEIALQFHQQGKVERWAENIWHWMVSFKDVVYYSLFEPVPVGIKLLAMKFVETLMLLFTSDAGDVEKSTSGGKEHVFNMSLLIGGNPVLDPAVLTSEANRCMMALLDMLRSANNLPGPLAIAVVNCLAVVSRKRPRHYGTVFSAFLDLNKNLEGATEGHVASLQYSLRSAFLGFLRCTHPTISESKDRLLKTLRAMNAGDAADQVLRQVDKLMRNQERASRDLRVSKDLRPSNQHPLSGDIMRKRPVPQDDEELINGVDRTHKRIHYGSNEQFAQTLQSNNVESDHVTSNGVSSKVPLLNSNLNPVEQMITVIAALLAEGERGANSLELLISQIHPDLLADIVITNMKHLPSAPPLVTKAQSQPVDMQNSPSFVAAQFMASVSTSTSLQASATAVNATFPDPTSSTNLSDSKRDPRRDPRRLDPRRLTDPIEAPNLAPVKKEAVSIQSGFNALVAADVPLSPPLTSHAERTGYSTSNTPVDEEIGGKPSIACSSQVILKMEEVNEGREMPSFQDLSTSSDNSVSSVHEVVEKPEAHSLSNNPLEDTSDGESLKLEDDHYSPAVSDTPVLEETYQELPQVPLYMELSLEQEQILREVVLGRLIGSEKMLESRDDCHTRMRLLARLVSQVDAHQHIASMLQKGIVLEYQRQQGHELVINMLYHLHARMLSESSEQSSAAAASVYEKLLLGVAKSLLDSLSASDKSFSRLLGEAPFLTDSTLELLENVCCSEGSDLRVKENRDGDRVTQGLGAVWSLILGRPVHRKACLNIVLKCAVHPHDDIRSKAIRLAANKLYLLGYLSEDIERYATDMLLSAVDQVTESRSSDGREMVNFEQSACGSEQTEPLTSVDNSVESAQDVSQTDSTISFPEAQRLISLYFALCTKKPSLLQLVFNGYSRASKTVKQAVHRHITTLTRALGSSYSEILNIISDPPKGCEHLLMLVLQILTEQASPSSELIATVKQLYETKLKDASILIPMLSSFSKNEVLPIFPRLVDLPIDKFQIALAHILQGSAHSGPALTPAEVLVAIHDINPEKGGIPLRKVTDACSACFEQRTVFTQQVLAKALNQMVDRTPLPLLFMRTVIQAIDAFPALVDFVMEILSKLVKRQIWKMPKLWVGFLKCVSQTQPHSFPVLLELPAPQLESALNKHANLRSSLAAYASQPSVKASLPRSTLAVLGLSNEPRVVPPMHTSDTSSSVRGITPT